MNKQELVAQIRKKQSYLCIGLDSDMQKIPRHLSKYADPVFEFNRQIIDATRSFCVSYKINTAFYESRGMKGWESLERTIHYIGKDHFTIADAKRGDIGNTSAQYAKTFFEAYPFHAVTVAPYMGADSVLPFLEYKHHWTILLGLTSNPGASDFELLQVNSPQNQPATTAAGNLKLYEQVIQKAATWGNSSQMMFVVGATRADVIGEIRAMVPDYFFLVPGVGAQGGSLKEISEKGMNKEVGLLVNVSRGIIFASGGEDFAAVAADEAAKYQLEMGQYIQQYATSDLVG